MNRLTDKDTVYNDLDFMDSGMAVFMNKLKEYEDLEEQGRLVIIPIKAGEYIEIE